MVMRRNSGLGGQGSLPRLGALAATLLAVGLLLFPVTAAYVSEVGLDTVAFRTASCGAPIGSLLGMDPGLGGGVAEPIGSVNAARACEATSGKRVLGGVGLLLLLASLGWVAERSRGKRTLAKSGAL